MKNKLSGVTTLIAFALVLLSVIAGFVLDRFDQSADIFPSDSAIINLYGEAHGYKKCYDIELQEWCKYYDEGCRNLFVELPYFSAEFLNEWMQEDSDELIDLWFDEIQDTQSGNKYYYDFFHELKERCPETIFYGTDVGHQYDTTGPRYLAYLEEKGLADSDEYLLANENIRQGIEFKAGDTEHNGMTAVRESYLIANFIDAYTRCGGGKIMGIYGSYHTSLYNPDLMAGKLREHYGDIMSSVKVTNIVFDRIARPYDLGFCITGLIFLLMLFIPNIIWAKQEKPAGYDESANNENKILLALERTGEVLTSVSLVIFTAINPKVMILEGFYFEWKIIIWITAMLLMVLYECYWIKYFRSAKRMEDFYMSYAGFPVAGATLPVIAVLLLGIYSGNVIVIAASIILGIGHIGIHLMHKRELQGRGL